MNLVKIFEEKYGRKPLLARAPGRINIIGEHTDYNDGFVLPAAIDRFAQVAIQKNDTVLCHVHALDLNEVFEFSIVEELTPADNGWKNIVLGVTKGFLHRDVTIKGFDVLITSDVPVGSGMSSSAAIECAFGTAMNELFDAGLNQEEIALIGQQAEHEFVGVMCGIMDQFASMFGKANHVIKIDCRSLTRAYYPADFGEYQIVLIDSKVKHELVESEYNIRREQCEKGVAIMQKNNPQIRALRDASLKDLMDVEHDMDAKVFDRCKYVIEENERVLEACKALSANNVEQVGELMNATHAGLSNLYEVSCNELDLLADLAQKEEAVIGSRMMGGGFGGCTINLIKREFASKVAERVIDEYLTNTGINAEVYMLDLASGAQIIAES
jgi:galactokinase